MKIFNEDAELVSFFRYLVSISGILDTINSSNAKEYFQDVPKIFVLVSLSCLLANAGTNNLR